MKATFQLSIIGVKKNPQSPMYTQLGVMTKGTVIEVNVSELGMVTTGGKVSTITFCRSIRGLIATLVRLCLGSTRRSRTTLYAHFSHSGLFID